MDKNKRFNPQVADHARKHFGEFIRNRRKELKLSATELAAMMGVHRNAITGIENGSANYTINVLFAALGCLRIAIHLEEKDPDNDVPGFGSIPLN